MNVLCPHCGKPVANGPAFAGRVVKCPHCAAVPNASAGTSADQSLVGAIAGTASIFMFTEPLSGWRMATARPSKTKVDWALEMARLLDSRYKRCEKVILVCDNLNTHTKGAFYEAFTPAQARQFVRRIEFRHTPKHGSWLNIAENELSSMTRQSIRRHRVGDLKTLREQIRAWSNDVNKTQRGVDWQMTVVSSLVYGGRMTQGIEPS